jgi:dehydrogenase/reductase SDR family protein 1
MSTEYLTHCLYFTGIQVGIPLDFVESPSYTGKAIVALATDKLCMSKTGSIQVVAEVAKEYGFTDVDGKQPPSIRSLKFLLPTYVFDQETKKKIPNWLIPDFKLPFFVMASPPPIRD